MYSKFENWNRSNFFLKFEKADFSKNIYHFEFPTIRDRLFFALFLSFFCFEKKGQKKEESQISQRF
jgi:hypothetical protein